MPAKDIRINLLGSSDLSHTPWGRLVSWATTYGRYIMITTEIVVLLAFISRFSLDRKNTDLTEELNQKQAILEANQEFEREVKSVQSRINTAKGLLENQSKPIELVNTIETLIPADVYLSNLDISANKINLSATAITNQGFAQFMSNLQSVRQIQNVLLGDIRREPATGIEFQLTADIVGPSKPK